MFAGRLIFKQVMDLMLLPIFRRCVANHQCDYRVRSFSCLDQFLCMAFAQITYRESLRDLEVCFRSQNKKPYHRWNKTIMFSGFAIARLPVVKFA